MDAARLKLLEAAVDVGFGLFLHSHKSQKHHSFTLVIGQKDGAFPLKLDATIGQ